MYKEPIVRITPANCRDGPRHQRAYTDCLCCIIYILYCLAIIILGIVYNKQTIIGYENPFDYDHNICIGDYPLLYMPTNDVTNTVCIQECPENKGGVNLKCQINSRYKTCPISPATLNRDFQYKICHGKGMDMDNVIKYNFIRQGLSSISSAKQLLLGTAGVTIVISLSLLILTFILPGIMTYIYFLLFLALLIIIASGFIYRYIQGRLPFVDQRVGLNYKNSKFTLGIGILFGLAFVITLLVMIIKRKKIKYIVNVLKISKKCFWDNWYMPLISLLLSLLSILSLFVNIVLIYISNSMGTINSQKHIPFGQFQPSFFSIGYSILILIQFLWTHGIIIAMSEFTFQSVAIHWYFNQKALGINYSRFKNFSSTVKLVRLHIGTICYGWILSWIPQTFIGQINKLEQSFPRFYKYFCCIHDCSAKYFSNYSYSQTILQSLPFMAASEQMYYLRKRAKNSLPNLYMSGSFYITSAKIFIQLFSIFLLYLICIFSQPDTYQDVINLVIPLIVIWIVSAQISTHLMAPTGIIGDTITLMYCADVQMQKYGYGGIDAYSCPRQIRPLIKQSKVA